MSARAQEFVQEVFLVKTDRIDFLGKIVRRRDGATEVKGEVLFRDGSHLAFGSPTGKEDRLRDMMIILCDRLADFYRTKVFSVKFHDEIEGNEFFERMREVRRDGLHHWLGGVPDPTCLS